MAADAVVARRVQRTGLALLQPAAGLAGLHTVLSALANPHAAAALVAVVPVDWSIILRASDGSSPPAFFEDVAAEVPSTASSDAGGPAVGSQLPAAIEAAVLPAAASLATTEAVHAAVLEAARSILGATLLPDQPLMEAGLDSLGEWACMLCAVALHAIASAAVFSWVL